MPKDNIKYGTAAQFGSAGGVLGMLGGLMGGKKKKEESATPAKHTTLAGKLGIGGKHTHTKKTDGKWKKTYGTLKKKGEAVHDFDDTTAKGATPFKLRSGNTTPFKMMGSSPAKFFGNVFGGGGIFGRRRGGGGGFQPENLFTRHTKQWWDRQREIRQKRAELRSQGLDPNQEKNWATTGPTGGGGGGDGAHTHGTGGEPIGGTDVAAAESPAAPVDEEMVA